MAENAVNTEQGVILEALNNKVDLNQLNTDNQGLSYVSGLGMPSGKYIDLELGASGATYTAPANGFYSVKKVAGVTNAYFNLHNITSGLTSQDFTSVTNNHLRLWLPCKKGDLMQVEYSATGNTIQFRFNYAEGEV